MENKTLVWNQETGRAFAWVVQDGEIITATAVLR